MGGVKVLSLAVVFAKSATTVHSWWFITKNQRLGQFKVVLPSNNARRVYPVNLSYKNVITVRGESTSLALQAFRALQDFPVLRVYKFVFHRQKLVNRVI